MWMGKKRVFEERIVTTGKMKEIKTVVFRDSLLTYEKTVSPPPQGKNYLYI